ncbi:MAG: alpha-glucosidase/alpha-galactosidase, partial [Clostridia bacterium]|nr:alpha-glucosidase/alpha-galactosidase [Clostridia bacterium]
IAAAGDRHLAEFCNRDEYLTDPETVKRWTFGLTTVEWRKNDLVKRLAKSERLLSGEEVFKLHDSGEEGVNQIRALLGLEKLVTNVNLPNRGQIENLPLGSVVETNAVFSADSVVPVMAGKLPDSIFGKVATVSRENDCIVEATFSEDLKQCFEVFCEGHLVKELSDAEKKALFEEMYSGTKRYLSMYQVKA